MFKRYKASIEDYCKRMGVDIPVGFDRHEAARYVAIDLQHSPPRLVATTWSKVTDVVAYLTTVAAERRTQLLDFKDRHEMTFNGKDNLLRGQPF